MADYSYVTLNGVIVPDTAVVLTDVQTEWKNAFGQDLIVTTNTPQGVMIAAETLARSEVLQNNASLANQINPNIAGGVFLDALMALTGSSRIAATFSTALVNLTGVPGTVVPEGVTGSLSTGEVFESVSTVTLSAGGTASVEFQAVEAGPINVVANALNQIVNGVLGLETINNPDPGTIGSIEQSDESTRTFRRNTLAFQGISLAEAVISNITAVPGVNGRPAYLENYTDSPITIDGITLVPHSIYLCVYGGTDTDIANALNAVKTGGTGYNGTTTVNVTDQFSGQVIAVKFDRPTIINILVRVTIHAGESVANPVAAVQKAILDYANGLLSLEPGFVVGANVSPFELSGAINIEVPGIYVKNVEISLVTPIDYQPTELIIHTNQIASVTQSAIQVVQE